MSAAAAAERSGLRLGRIAGIDIVADWSLLVIFSLITFSLAAGLFPSWHPGWSAGLAWLTAFGAAVLFFASLLAHELSHAIVARLGGMRMRRITLFGLDPSILPACEPCCALRASVRVPTRAQSIRAPVRRAARRACGGASGRFRRRRLAFSSSSSESGALMQEPARTASIAVHYPPVAADAVGKLRWILDKTLSDHPRLRLGHGKKVFEIRPDIDWSKGEAVLWILRQISPDWPGIVPLYVGDDITDEDAFHVLAGRGLCIAVRHDESRQTAADYAVADTPDVKRLLEMLVAIAADVEAQQGARP
ncbi:MAG: trehalose-phosphatase [Burkholderiales bacterium]